MACIEFSNAIPKIQGTIWDVRNKTRLFDNVCVSDAPSFEVPSESSAHSEDLCAVCTAAANRA